jgi:hypothetical protein
MFNLIKKIIVYTLIIGTLLVLIPQKSYAVFGAGDTVVVVADTSPTGINNYINHIMTHLKDFVLDKLATILAKQILHQLTVSVINWINTGFQGSPSFLQNPGAFFLDVADQVSGAFLAGSGPLSSLCSPFAIDIRLGLALNQTTLSTKRYTCTFSKIYEAQKNGPDITINGKVINSSKGSMNGFLKGDFNQGGWPAFISITTEPQNNPYGAFLSAQGDLNARINAKQNVIHADLQLGQGFMSWQSCKDIPGGTIDPEDPDQVMEAESIVGNDPSVKTKNNKDGTQTYQTCETQTPGSVIAGQLQTSLNVPAVELELANDINAVINALITKMISTLISGGLGSLSSGGSGSGGRSYTQEVITEINSEQALQNSTAELRASINASIDEIPRYSNQYKQGIDQLVSMKNQFISARSCLEGRGNYAEISEIDNTIATNIDPEIAKLQAKYDAVMSDKKKLQDMLSDLSNTTTTSGVKTSSSGTETVKTGGSATVTLDSSSRIQDVANRYTEYVRNGGANIVIKINDADAALADTQTQIQRLNTTYVRYQFICQGIR